MNAVIELSLSRTVCLELHKDCKELGRIMLRYAGHTIAAGLVTEVSPALYIDIIELRPYSIFIYRFWISLAAKQNNLYENVLLMS